MIDRQLRVCVDLSPAANMRAGIGRYADQLGRHLLDLDGVETTFFAATARPERLPAYTAGRLRARWNWNTKRWRFTVLLGQLLRQSWDGRFAGADVVHCTEHLLVPLAHIPTVLTVHDVVYVTHPEWHKAWNHRFLSLAMPIFARRARAIIAVSEYTAGEAVSLLHADPARVHVVHEGVDDRFRPVRDPEALAQVRARYRLQQPFILFVGAIEPRKNLPLLLRAFAALCREPGFQHQLIIAGGKGWLYDEVFATAESLGLGERLRFTGYVADEDLPALYSAAEFLAHPEQYAGFGLPPLEAMACGTPVVAADATSLPEVVGQAGILVPPHDERAWVEALRRLAGDGALRQRLSAAGLAQAARFTWEETARQTAAVYQRVAGEKQRDVENAGA